MMDYILIATLAILFGWREAYIYFRGFLGGNYTVWKLHWYHLTSIVMLLIVMVWAMGFWGLRFAPLFALIEDISYWVAIKLYGSEQRLDKDSWVNFGLGGWGFKKLWVPNIYMIGLSLFFLLEAIRNGAF